MNRFRFIANSTQETDQLGAALADVLPAGTTIALCGTLGAGKTRLVQAIAAAYGVARQDVVSPTFVLYQQYRGRISLHHFDAYRVRDDDEFLELGPEESFQSAGITIVEWADRVIGCLPPDRLEIHVEVTGATSREFQLIALSDRLQAVVDQLQARLQKEK
jgi:tRNA threonylcarbamoyladenosine biosynthesis protein TsaE